MKVLGVWLGPYLAHHFAFDQLISSFDPARVVYGRDTNVFLKTLSGLIGPTMLITLVLLMLVGWAELRFRGPRSWLIPLILVPFALSWYLFLIKPTYWADMSSLGMVPMLATSAVVKILIGVGISFGIAWIYREKLPTSYDVSDEI